VEEYQPEKIILFGSHAWGQPTADSDLDLLVIKDDPETRLRRTILVRRMIRDFTQYLPIDLMVMTPKEVEARLRVGDHFVEGITTNGEALYAP
jgi:predicted nucleotidyltransferase